MKLPMPSSLDALAEAMGYSPEMVLVQPPYSITIGGLATIPQKVRGAVERASSAITPLGRDDGVSIVLSE